jgi:hypothetical protein
MTLNDTIHKNQIKKGGFVMTNIKRLKTNVFMMIVLTIILVFLAANVFKTPLLADTAMCASEKCVCTCAGSNCYCSAQLGSCYCRCIPGTEKFCNGEDSGGGPPDIDPIDDPE